MEIKAAVFDIDGTLLPQGKKQINQTVARALTMLKKSGVKVIIATGRPLFTARPALAGVKVDYFISGNGGSVNNGAGRTVYTQQMTAEEMYALVDFCEDYEVPLSFSFSDGYYCYVESERLFELGGLHPATDSFMYDGEDQNRHLQDMPYAATAFITPEQTKAFTQKYGHLGIRFLPFAPDKCDVVRPGVDKSIAVEQLLQELGITWQQTAAFGDGVNDADLLARAGLAVTLENGVQALKDIAHVIAPHCDEDGVVHVITSHLMKPQDIEIYKKDN